MSTQIKPSGPAFPVTINDDLRTDCATTLRDYFAAKALCGYLSGRNTNDRECYHEQVAKSCYAYADAMLKAREVKL